METQVTVIGAGPVGLTLAMDLASRGVDVPILYEHARTFDRIKLVPETAFVRYDDSGDGVTATCERRSGETVTIRSRYLVGCDGASSTVRKQMGVHLLGDAEISKARSSLIRCPAIKDLFSGSSPGTPRTSGFRSRAMA